MGPRGAAVDAVICERLVVAHALFIHVDHLVLESIFGDTRAHHVQLAQRRVLFSVREDARFSLCALEIRSCLLHFQASHSALSQGHPPLYDVLRFMEVATADETSEHDDMENLPRHDPWLVRKEWEAAE